MKYNNKHTKLSVSGENIYKPLKVEVVRVFPPNSKKYKNINKGKGKKRIGKVTYLLFTLYLI